MVAFVIEIRIKLDQVFGAELDTETASLASLSVNFDFGHLCSLSLKKKTANCRRGINLHFLHYHINVEKSRQKRDRTC